MGNPEESMTRSSRRWVRSTGDHANEKKDPVDQHSSGSLGSAESSTCFQWQCGKLIVNEGFAFERDARVARRAQQLLEMRGPKYPDKVTFVRSNPVPRWECPDGADRTLVRYNFIHYEKEHAC